MRRVSAKSYDNRQALANARAGKVNKSPESIPLGVIVMWSGSVASIPSGWGLCDGTHGTPDLRDKFIVGARQDEAAVAKTNVTGALTQSGGSTALPAHTHGIDHNHASFDSGAESAHTHDINHDHGSFNAGSESSHTHTAGTLAANLTLEAAWNQIIMKGASCSYTYDRYVETNAKQDGSGSMTTGTAISGTSSAGSSHNHSVDVPALGTTASGAGSSHSHSVDVPATSGEVTGSQSSATVLPPYYSLCFIMKLYVWIPPTNQDGTKAPIGGWGPTYGGSGTSSPVGGPGGGSGGPGTLPPI
jgi:hypothetical protein